MAKRGSATQKIFEYIKDNPGCSYQEIAKFMGYTSTAPVGYHVAKLQLSGIIEFNPKVHRSLRAKDDRRHNNLLDRIGRFIHFHNRGDI